MSYSTDIKCACGGSIEIYDWGVHVFDADFRFEAACTQCLTCDPNGYATLDECRVEAKEYFAK